MRKLMIYGGGAVAVLLAIVIGVTVFVASNLDDLVKKGIEMAGSEVTGTKVSVGDVKISLTEGTASIGGLSVANPKGFNTPNAFTLGRISVALDTSSVTGNPVVIKDISVDEPHVTYELGDKGSNLDALQKAIEAKTGGGKAASSSKPAASSEGGEQKQVVIDRLTISKGTVTLATPIPGVDTTSTLGKIVLTDIGRKSKGADPVEVAEKVLGAITDAALKSASAFSISNVSEKVKGIVPAEAGNAINSLFGK